VLKKVIKYEDWNGEMREETFYFHLSKSELTKMEMSEVGGLEQKINRLVETRNGAEIVGLFEEVITLSYGEKSPDGRRFEKSEELSRAFMQTPAYDELFMEIAMDANKAAAFFNGILPQDLSQSAAAPATPN